MEKHNYNYRNVFNEPIKIKQLTQSFSLPYFIKLRDVLIYLLTLVILFIVFHSVVSFISSYIPLFTMLFYVGMPYLSVRLVEKVQPDGKNIFWYLLDYITFYFEYLQGKKKICHDIKASYTDKPVVFDEFNYRKKGNYGKRN